MTATSAQRQNMESPEAEDLILPPTVTLPALLDRGASGVLLDRQFRQMLYDLLYLDSRMREARDRLGGAMGLSGPAYTVLMTIAQFRDADAPGAGFRVRDVADRLHVTGAFVTAEVNGLVGRGLVAKNPDPADGRAVRLVLTAEGYQQVCRLVPQIQAINDLFFRGLSAKEFALLSALAARLSRQASQALPSVQPVE